MGDKSSIEWLDDGATWTPVRARSGDKVGWHCEHVTEACRFCYAERLNRRLGTGLDFKPGHLRGPAPGSRAGPDISVFLDEAMLRAPLRWRRHRRIFVFSMSDLFGSWVLDAWLDWIFAVMAVAPQHTYILLTKRPERMRRFMLELQGPRMALVEARVWDLIGEGAERCPPRSLIGTWPWPHVWAGVSCSDQPDADMFIPLLLDTPVARRIVSLEPLLGPIDLTRLRDADAGEPGTVNALTGTMETATRVIDGEATLSWIIVGGESGPEARPMHPAWPRALRDQCAEAGVPYFFKQWGEWLGGEVYAKGDSLGHARHQDGSDDSSNRHGGKHDHWWSGDASGGVISTRVGRKAAGRLLDGLEWNEAPRDGRP